MNDLRYAFRQLRKAPGLHADRAGHDRALSRRESRHLRGDQFHPAQPLPFPQSDRLVTIYNTYPKAGVENDGSSLTNYYERRGNIPAFSSLSIYRDGTEVVGEPGSTEQEEVMRVSPEFFATLGVGPAMGRAFTEPETITPVENHGVAILRDAYWRQRLNSDPNVLGQDIRVNGCQKDRRRLASRFSLPLLGSPHFPTAHDRSCPNADRASATPAAAALK